MAAFVGGMLRQVQGDYTAAFLVAGITGVAAAALAMMIKRGPALPAQPVAQAA